MRKVSVPLARKDIKRLRAGDEVLLSGVIYTARDQAHQRLSRLIKKDKRLPLSLKSQVIYYSGATATPEGKAIGSCGPTTSARMDNFVGPLLRRGLLAMIGKGRRSKAVRELIKKHKAIYFIAPGGCGALLAAKVLAKETIAFRDLGPEAISRLKVEDFPLIVAIDTRGKSIYADLK